MQPAYRLSRRKFIQAALVATAGSAATVACGRTGSSPWRFLTVDEARTLAAACDQIIPSDDAPGAAWAGVVNFMDRQLCGPYRRLRDSYRAGIAGIEKSSRLLYGSDFAVLPQDKQVELLTKMEQGKAPQEAWQKISSTEFFGLLVDHTMQGFYGDPRHGGNRERASWKMVGLSYPMIRGRLKYDLTKG
ncbi:MAG TPA: gluconate 2-dehydrogenase subunit 3 family protein [Terriglobales bacterium]|nr:gluconate 2-dehydrogenase subunit 3 family protein [Terriglobales bacterium]